MPTPVCELLRVFGGMHLRARRGQRDLITLAGNHVRMLHLARVIMLVWGIGFILRLHSIEVEIGILMPLEVHA